MNISQRKLIAKRLGVILDQNGFIHIPEDLTHIKIDVGLSFSAIHAISWLKKDDSLFVIGFEPLVENVQILKKTLEKNHNVKERFLIVSCALSNKSEQKQIFVTSDTGLASFFEPKQYPFEAMRSVNTESLDNFMNLINWKNFNKIDYIKTDCQGFDLEVLKGAKNTLKNTVVVTCEADSNAYVGANNSPAELEKFLNELGFEYINKVSIKSKLIRKFLSRLFSYLWRNSNAYRNFVKAKHDTPKIKESNLITIDPTFVNAKFKHLIISGEVTGNQFN
jgi:FkbM family methyltransferase